MVSVSEVVIDALVGSGRVRHEDVRLGGYVEQQDSLLEAPARRDPFHLLRPVWVDGLVVQRAVLTPAPGMLEVDDTD